MNNIKNKLIKLFYSVLLITAISSCDKGGEPNPGGTSTKDFAGDWFIDIKETDGVTSRHDHALHATYNTSANDNTMWIDDWLTRKQLPDGASPTASNQPSGEYLRSKITIDPATGSFSCINQPNLNDTGTVTITDGKFEKRGGISKGGNIVDKISFKAEFSYDPGKKYIFIGHKRTGLFEDEY
jgi:Lipid-binding putative hydrolase